MGTKFRRYLVRHHLALIALFVALGGTSYAVVGKNQVTSESIRKGAVKSVDVKNNNLTGKDVNEAKLDGTSVGRFSTDDALCNPPSQPICETLAITLSRPSRLLVIGDGRKQGTGEGACQLRVDDVAISNGTSVVPASEAFSTVGVSRVLGRGEHEVTMFCSETVAEFQPAERHLAAVSLSPR